jgi:uncharacterized NAD(P)/FAD-binding protein YdhS
MVAANLLREGGGSGLRVVLVEKTGRFGPGLAYGTASAAHLLNVPAGRMSAWAEDPDHFVRWLRPWKMDARGGSFVARSVYGRYVSEVLDGAEEEGRARGARLERVRGAATALMPLANGALVIAGTNMVWADRVVLALGNPAPADPRMQDAAFYSSARYVREPWAAGALDGIGADEPVLLMGTGLTMVDVALELRARGHRAGLVAVSRHGLLPLPHRSPARPPAHPEPPPGLDHWEPTALGLLRAVRGEMRSAALHGIDWREVLVSIRAQTPRLWAALPMEERRRFMEHLRAFWDAHRHRAAPDSMAGVRELIRAGVLNVGAERVVEFREDASGVEVVVRTRGREETRVVRVGRVVNCTGPDADLSRSTDPLVVSLRRRGAIRCDALGLGLDTAADGAVIDADGAPSRVLYAVGPMRRGSLWETTAVPELRVQARDVARRVRESLGGVPVQIQSGLGTPASPSHL